MIYIYIYIYYEALPKVEFLSIRNDWGLDIWTERSKRLLVNERGGGKLIPSTTDNQLGRRGLGGIRANKRPDGRGR